MGSAANTITAQKPDEWLATRLRGTSVLGSDGVKIGSVDDILIDRSGSIKALVIGVSGFLGIGAKDVAIPFKQFRSSPLLKAVDVLALSMTGDQLADAQDLSRTSRATQSRPDQRPAARTFASSASESGARFFGA
jgi:sporulation protein YlmC with PRC-barrel domain